MFSERDFYRGVAFGAIAMACLILLLGCQTACDVCGEPATHRVSICRDTECKHVDLCERHADFQRAKEILEQKENQE